MYIVRDGKQIELTASERIQAYHEQLHVDDIEEIRDRMRYDSDIVPDEFENADFISDVAYSYRDKMYRCEDEDGDRKYDCYKEALDDTRKEYL